MKRYVIIALALAAASCENASEYNGAQRDPKMIISAIMGPNMANLADDAREVYVKESVSIFGDRKPQPVEGAQFTLLHNGTVATTTTTDGVVYYHFPMAAGDKIELKGSSPLHGTVTATDIVPEKAVIKKIEHKWFMRDGRQYLRLKVTIADKPGEHNYYRFAARNYYKVQFTEKNRYDDEPRIFIDEHSFDNEIFYDDEIAFKSASNDPGGDDMTWSCISDELFSGREYTFDLFIKMEHEVYANGHRVKPEELIARTATIEVQTLSENLFKYIRSADIQANEHNFSEPTRMFTNIAGGYGILGTYNAAEAVADIKADIE